MDEHDTARFWAKVDRCGRDECWLWMGGKLNSGYGEFRIGRQKNGNRSMATAHRLAYIATHGAIRRGLWVLHRCDVKLCCNPAHLFLGTPAENTADMHRKGRASVGERHPGAKLTRDQVQQIRSLLGTRTQRVIARQFGVSYGTISLIACGRIWVDRKAS